MITVSFVGRKRAGEDHLIAHMDGSRHLLPVLAPKMDGAVNLHVLDLSEDFGRQDVAVSKT